MNQNSEKFSLKRSKSYVTSKLTKLNSANLKRNRNILLFRIMENIEKVEFTPLNISDEELADIPDCQFYVCEYDVLKNDGQIMHARLQKLKKNTQITLIEG